MEIVFKPFQEEDIPKLIQWLAEPHVKKFWQEPESMNELREKYLTKLLQRGVYPHTIHLNGKAVGYIQYYSAHKIGGGWWPVAKPGTFGIDQFIGDPSFVGKGFGPMIISSFIEMVCKHEKVTEIIADPDPDNTRAIRAFEKVGFKKGDLITTPNGKALLMTYSPSDNRS